MNCILERCTHFRTNACKLFGSCGAKHALEQSRLPGGYEIVEHDNRTLRALEKNGLVTIIARGDRTVTIAATAHGRELKSPVTEDA